MIPLRIEAMSDRFQLESFVFCMLVIGPKLALT